LATVALAQACEIRPIRGDIFKHHAPYSTFSGKQFLHVLRLP